MFRFFRKIRSKFYEQGDIRKYLLYALGEIFFIVIGILIALQINNWNERKQETQLSDEMVSEIKTGIESDLKELNSFINTHQEVMRSQVIISKWLSSKTDFSDSLSINLSRAYMAKDYEINYSAYETLKSFGLKSIKSKAKRRAVSNLYEFKYPEFQKFSTIYQKFLDDLLAGNSKHFNEINYMQATMRPLNPQNLKGDSEYIYRFNTLKNFSYLLIFQGTTLKKEMEKTLKEIG